MAFTTCCSMYFEARYILMETPLGPTLISHHRISAFGWDWVSTVPIKRIFLFIFCLVGGSDIYAVLVCGNDSKDKINAAVFDRDLYEFKNVLEDCRIIGVR